MGILHKATTSAHGAVDQMAEAAAPAAQWLDEQGESLTSGGKKLLDGTCKYVVRAIRCNRWASRWPRDSCSAA